MTNEWSDNGVKTLLRLLYTKREEKLLSVIRKIGKKTSDGKFSLPLKKL